MDSWNFLSLLVEQEQELGMPGEGPDKRRAEAIRKHA